MDVALVSAIVGGVLAIIAALVAGSISIITTLRTRNVVTASAEANLARGTVRDAKIQEIHLLVNSRLLTVLRLLVSVTKKMADATGSRDDAEAYAAALMELQKAEASAVTVAQVVTPDSQHDEQLAIEAERRLSVMLRRRAAN